MAEWPHPNLDEQALVGTWPGEAEPVNGTLQWDVRTAHSAALLAVRAFTDASTAIERDEDRSETGKAKARALAAKDVLAQVHQHQARLAAFRRDRDALLEPVRFLPQTDADRIIARMDAGELRAHLYQLDPLERGIVLREAAERGDLPTLTAVRAAPAYAPLADEKFLAELEVITLEAVPPSKAAELRAADEAIAATEAALETAANHIERQAGQTAPDPVREMAEPELREESNA